MGWIPGQVIQHRAEANVIASNQSAAAEQSRLRAIPASEHLAWGKTEFDALTKSWDPSRFDRFVTRLYAADQSSPEYADIQKLLNKGWTLQKNANEKILKEQANQEKKTAKDLEIQRISYAKTLENELLDKRMNADVTTGGPNHTILTIKWALVSKVTARDIEKNHNLHQNMRDLRFKKLVITDGFGSSWYWTY